MRTKCQWPQLKFEDRAQQQAIDGGILSVSVVQKDDVAIVNIDGVIGDGDFYGTTISELIPQIQAIETPINLRLRTPGGLVSQAIDAFDVIANHPHMVTADIIEASSAGTIFAAAADLTRIAVGGTYMIHEPWTGWLVMGNRFEIREMMTGFMAANLETLDAIADQLADIVAERTGKTRDEVLDLMDGGEGNDGTTFVGQEAVDAGLVDELIPVPKRKDGNAEQRALQNRRLAHYYHQLQANAGKYGLDRAASVE